jgi:hypothetical protein
MWSETDSGEASGLMNWVFPSSDEDRCMGFMNFDVPDSPDHLPSFPAYLALFGLAIVCILSVLQGPCSKGLFPACCYWELIASWWSSDHRRHSLKWTKKSWSLSLSLSLSFPGHEVRSWGLPHTSAIMCCLVTESTNHGLKPLKLGYKINLLSLQVNCLRHFVTVTEN